MKSPGGRPRKLSADGRRALVAKAMGLAAAIPAAVAYNYFGHRIKEMGARMEDFMMEFLNLTERNFM